MMALGTGLQGGNPQPIIQNYRDALQREERKAAISNLLGSMTIAGPEKAILETLPLEAQQQWLLQRQQQQRAQQAAQAQAARKAEEERMAMEAFQGYMRPRPAGGAVPQSSEDAPIGPTRAAAATPPAMDAQWLTRAMMDPRLTDEQRARLQDIYEINQPKPAREMRVETLRDGRKYYVDPTGQMPPRPVADAGVIPPPQPGGMTEDQLDLANTYRDDLNKNPYIEHYQLVEQGKDTIEALYMNPGAVSDYALAVGFAKIVDPGSVAREGEVSAVQGSTAIGDRLKQQIINALTGEGALPDEARAEIADLAFKFYNRSAERAASTLDVYRTRADRQNIPFDEVWAGGDIQVLSPDYLQTLRQNPTAKARLGAAPREYTQEEISGAVAQMPEDLKATLRALAKSNPELMVPTMQSWGYLNDG